MLRAVNRLFVILVMLAAMAGILLSIAALFLPMFLGEDLALRGMEDAGHRPDFTILQGPVSPSPTASPQVANFTIKAPRLEETDMLALDTYGSGRYLAEVDCLEEFESYENYSNLTQFTCAASLPYAYVTSQDYVIYATLSGHGKEYAAGPVKVHADWSSYEQSFWGFAWVLLALAGGVYLFLVLPIALLLLHAAAGMMHKNALPGEYSLRSLLTPFSVGKTLLQKLNSFIVSPYFWALELAGIVILLLYMVIAARIWESGTALFAFVISGLLSFIIPFLWCAAWWYADFREREPLRIMVTFFLWGMLAALMAIGMNTVTGVVFGFVGLGFLSTFLVAPPLEEFYKGSGLALLSGHHEYDSVEDGFAFGFVIGMGFSFIEDWIYLLDNPMGSDIPGWLVVFLMRSLLFSANHGIYTALAGGVIGYLKERGFRAPALGLLLALPVSALFHGMHNSGEMLNTLLGGGGLLVYCCLLIPLFDYGGLVILLLLFLRAVLRRKPG